MRVRFVYRRAIEDELRRDPVVEKSLDTSAGRIANAAKGFAPVRTGRYVSSIVVGHELGEGGGQIAQARATAPYAAYVEWGTSRPTPDLHPLARGVAAVTGGLG